MRHEAIMRLCRSSGLSDSLCENNSTVSLHVRKRCTQTNVPIRTWEAHAKKAGV